MMTIGLTHYLLLGGLLFSIGMAIIIIKRSPQT